MTFEELKQHSIAPMKDLPIEVQFGAESADLMFTKHEQLRLLRADRLRRIDLGLEAATGKKSQRRGGFSAVWRTTYSDCDGYDCFMANLLKRSWADI